MPRFRTPEHWLVFLFSLENNVQVVGRVVLPVRESFNTKAEVATMEQIYLYCSTPHNPVRAGWILMEYMPGRTLWDCFETFTLQQKLRTAAGLANILSSLFRITVSQCGSIGCPWRFRFQDPSLSSAHVFSRLHFLIENVVGQSSSVLTTRIKSPLWAFRPRTLTHANHCVFGSASHAEGW